MTKNVAGTCRRLRTLRISGVHRGSGPSSNVRATVGERSVLRRVGTRCGRVAREVLRDDRQAQAGEERDNEEPDGREERELAPAKPGEPARETSMHGNPAPVLVTRPWRILEPCALEEGE
jgi:hypothetical protein